MKTLFRCLIVFAIIASATIAMLWQPMISMILKYAIQGYFENKLATSIYIDQITHENDYWLIEKPIFEGKVSGKADSLVIHYSWEMWKRILHLDIDIENPHFKIIAESVSEEVFSQKSNPSLLSFNLLNLQLALSIDKGHLYFPENDQELSIQLDGQWHSQGRGNCVVLLQGMNPSKNRIALIVTESDNGIRQVKVDMHNTDCMLFETALRQWFPLSIESPWHLSEGNMTGQLIAELSQERLSNITGDLIIEQLTFHSRERQLFGVIPAASLCFKGCSDVYGKCALLQPAFFAIGSDKGAWNIHDVNGGVLLTAHGMEVDFEAACTHLNESHPVHLKGKANFPNKDLEIDLLLPSINEKSASAHLTVLKNKEGSHEVNLSLENCLSWQKNVCISALVSASEKKEIHIQGEISCLDHSRQESLSMPFGVLLNKRSCPSDRIFHQLLGLCGYSLSEGWFEGVSIPVNNESFPFLNASGLNFSGVINMYGSFNQNHLAIHYGIQNLLLENGYLQIEVPSLITDTHFLNAVHYFDFSSGKQGGSIGILDSNYIEKNTQLRFSNMEGQVLVCETGIDVTEVEAFCNDIYFAGEISVDFNSKEQPGTKIAIRASTIGGKASNAQKMVANIHPNFLCNIPLEGDLSLRQDAYLNIFVSDHTETQFVIQGTLSDGKLFSQDSGKVSLREINVNFDYDLSKSRLYLSDLQGTLLVGPGEKIEEYLLIGERIYLSDYSQGLSEFDFWIGDKSRDIIRVAGKTFANDKGNIEFSLDPSLSHLGTIHPHQFQLIVSKELTSIEYFRAEFEFQIADLFHDLQRFSRIGFAFLPEHLNQELNKPKSVAGLFKVAFLYDNRTTALDYQVNIENFSVDQRQFNKVSLHGTKKDKIWKINQLQFDDISLGAECFYNDGIWNIPFLGIKWRNALLMGLEGIYSLTDRSFEAKINLLEVDLHSLSDGSSFPELISKYQLKGDVRASGHIKGKLTNGKPRWKIEAELNASIKKAECYGLSWNSMDHVAIRYKSEEGVSVTLPKGSYFFQDYEHCLNTLTLNWNPSGVSASAEYLYQNNLFWLVLKAKNGFLGGELFIYNLPPEKQLTAPLTIHWKRQEGAKEGIWIHKIEGQTSGIKAELEQYHTDAKETGLRGEVIIDPRIACTFLSPEWDKMTSQWQLNGRYRLIGDWTIPKHLGELKERLAFNGVLEGKEWGFNGYLFNKLGAEIVYSSGLIQAKNVKMEDPAGTAIAETLLVKSNGEYNWEFSMPHLAAHHFRPSLVQRVDTDKGNIPQESSFIIKKMEIEEFEGNIFDSTTFRAKGKSECFNLPKQETPHPIWNIPSDILSKLGLDLSALNPVSGKVHFRIADRKIYFTKLKEMYSVGHLSKFYLPKHASQPSFLDFDGNLFVQIKMRQYNILFKLAELFTVTIQGSWSQPSYSILPQSYKEASSVAPS